MSQILIKIISLALFSPLFLNAQIPGNLVPNYSFDELDKKKIKELNSIELATGWKAVTDAQADLFSKDSKDDVGAPMNVFGREEPEDGSNYAGLHFWTYKGNPPVDYITTELTSPLEAGKLYCVGFMVSLSDLSKYASNNIGAHLSAAPVQQPELLKYQIEPQIVHSRNKVFNEMYTWEKICRTYEAVGGEKHITIGNFKDNDKTETLKMKRPKGFSKPQKTISYYYVENVYVSSMDSLDECICEKETAAEKMQVVYQHNVSTDVEMKGHQKFNFHMVVFDFLTPGMNDQSKSVISEVVKLMQEHPELKIEVQGHSEKQEEIKYQGNLSEERSFEVRNALIDAGIDAERLKVAHFKAEKPKSKSDGAGARAKNRRVEFVVISSE